MKKLLPALFLTLAANGSMAQFRCQELKSETHLSATPSIDNRAKSDTFNILHYDLHLDFTALPGRYLVGRCDIQLVAKQNNNGRLNLDLLQLQVDSVLQEGQPLNYSHNDTIVAVDLLQNPAPGDSILLSVYYNGNPPGDGSGWGGWHQQNGYYYNLGVGFAANPHTYGRAWHPCFDNFVEKATYDFHIKTRTPLRPYCNGLRISETQLAGDTLLTHWSMTDSIPTYLASIAISNYAEISDTIAAKTGTMPVQLMAKPADSAKMVGSFQNLKPIFHSMEEAFGPYYWQKVGYAATTVGAMEHATSIHLPTNLITGNLSGEDIIAHELAHHWWGNLVTCETDADMWINEGMSEFSSHLYEENLYGREKYISTVRQNAYDVLERAHVRDNGYKAIQGLDHEYVYGYHVYQKGAMVAHNLRAYLGDSLFFSGLTTLLNNNKYGNLNSTEFRDQLNGITGVGLNSFFDNWIFNPGFPQVSVDSLYVPELVQVNTATVKVSQRLHHAPSLYNGLPVFVTFFSESGDTTSRRMVITGAETTANFQPLPFQPAFAVVGYNGKMLTADAYDEHKITGPGNFADLYSKMDITVNAVADSATLIVMHHYAGPGGKKPAWADFRLSPSHYWTIQGTNLDETDFSARIALEGKAGGLDEHLLAQTGDSLMLLYRKDASHEWQLWPYQQTTAFGPPGNMMGHVTADSLKAGDYCFANTDESIGIMENERRHGSIDVFPNPAGTKLNVRVRGAAGENYSVKILDMGGKTVYEEQWKKETSGAELQVDIANISSDFVIVQVGDELTRKVVLEK